MKKVVSRVQLSFYVLLPALFLLQCPCSLAQKRYLFHTYTLKDGLINNTIFSINQDNKGYLWITTDGGISRFDGAYFDNTLVPQVNKAQAFCQLVDKSPSGKMAFATFMEGVIVKEENDKLKQYLRRKKQLGKNVVRALKWISDNQIITSESRNLNMIDGDSIYQIYDCGENRNMFQTIEYDAGEGDIWFGGLDGLGVIFGDKKVKTPFFLPEMKDVFVVKLLFWDKNTLLAGTRQGYYEINIKSYTVTQPFPELANQKINHLYRDRQNNIWVSCVTDGVYQIRDKKIVRHITQESGLPTSGAMCVFQDDENNYWFGTESGLCRLYSLTDFSYAYNGEQLTDISHFSQDPFKHLWLSDRSTLYFIEKDNVSDENIIQAPFPFTDLISSSFDKEKCYFFTEKGLFTMPSYEKTRWTGLKKEIDFAKNDIQDLKCYYNDEDGTLWLGCVSGLYTYRSNRLQKVKILSDKPLQLRPKTILKDRYNSYWIGDYTFGLHRFKSDDEDENGALVLQHVKSYESLKPDSAFATAWIQDMMLDHSGNLWISSLYTGVYKLQIDALDVKKATLYSTKNGLSSNDIAQIAEGKDRTFWFATSNGADRLVTDKNGKEKILHYNEKNGFGRKVYQILPDDSVTYISYEEGFFAVENRLDKYRIDKPLRVVISNISIMGKPDSAALTSGNKVYKIPYYQNFIAFDFGAVRLRDNEGVDYQYKLEGIDKGWSEYSARRYAGYNSLPAGKYIFKVRARMVNNEKDEPVTEYHFQVTPPFYRTVWFISLLAILAGAVIYYIYFQRIKNLLKLQKLRVKIASDLHDDIGSTLSSISIMSDLLQSQLDNSSRSEQMIREIGSNAHTMLDSMDDIIWSVNPSNDKFQNLALRIREYAIPLFEMKSIRFSIVTPEEMNSLPIPMDVRRNVFLIAKEAINNLVKYSECSEARVEFSMQRSLLVLTVADNGKGFDISSVKPHRNGLQNMKDRAGHIHGNFSISSELGKGTTVTFSVKII